MGYSPWGHKESDMTERARAQAHTHTRLRVLCGQDRAAA